ncbi:MAG TPA: gamma-glutamylcyclotransferase family protein [Aliidongia sp.]|uniref:gamma-glutamylcyclotransferase family protein n=1 Tax=Aliidongia sp. TaxID=1914230 RepID=UPI002DDCE236|nr:gamma-glutamylcyclotransferase family protein [Aliidongia sp.]HEV2673926.1 gamma-glutamylcyclotransferase family protein [Aliidongia sp.]
MTPPRRYFAYGSNIVTRQMAHRCPAACAVGLARLEGWRFRIMTRGFATIVPDPAAHVLGVVWTLTPDCEAALDRYEGVARGLYAKHEMPVDGLATLVYVASDVDPGPPKPGYLEAIIAAARDRSFAADYVTAELQSWLA